MKEKKYAELKELKNFLKRKNCSYKNLSNELGISIDAINNKLNGYTLLNINEMGIIISVFEMSNKDIKRCFLPECLNEDWKTDMIQEGEKMSRKRKLDLRKFNISAYAYKEMEYFCMQYKEKKKKIDEGYGISAVRYDKERSKNGNINDPTFENAARVLKLKKDVEIIERAAMETDEVLYKYILKNVTEGTAFDVLNIPCGRRQFYDKRKMFFYKLYKLKNEIVWNGSPKGHKKVLLCQHRIIGLDKTGFLKSCFLFGVMEI